MPSRSRNIKRVLFTNQHTKYRDILKRKKRTHITQWTTQVLRQITPADRSGISERTHIWKTGDRYSKLASLHYNSPEYWWIIAYYNQAPTEGHLKVGDVIIIPTPLDRLLAIL